MSRLHRRRTPSIELKQKCFNGRTAPHQPSRCVKVPHRRVIHRRLWRFPIHILPSHHICGHTMRPTVIPATVQWQNIHCIKISIHIVISISKMKRLPHQCETIFEVLHRTRHRHCLCHRQLHRPPLDPCPRKTTVEVERKHQPMAARRKHFHQLKPMQLNQILDAIRIIRKPSLIHIYIVRHPRRMLTFI